MYDEPSIPATQILVFIANQDDIAAVATRLTSNIVHHSQRVLRTIDKIDDYWLVDAGSAVSIKPLTCMSLTVPSPLHVIVKGAPAVMPSYASFVKATSART